MENQFGCISLVTFFITHFWASYGKSVWLHLTNGLAQSPGFKTFTRILRRWLFWAFLITSLAKLCKISLAHLTIGLAFSPGFYYDGYFGDDDHKAVEKDASQIYKANQ